MSIKNNNITTIRNTSSMLPALSFLSLSDSNTKTILYKSTKITFSKRNMHRIKSIVHIHRPPFLRNMSHLAGQQVTTPNAACHDVNPQLKNRKFHRETTKTTCVDENGEKPADCDTKDCSMVCQATGETTTIGHLTSASKMDPAETQDKTVHYLSDTNAIGESRPQYFMRYAKEREHDASSYESEIDPVVTAYVNQPEINKKIRNASSLPGYDQK